MKYKSCRLLEYGIYFYLDPGSKQLCVGHCCNTDHLDLPHRLYLYDDLKNQTLNWDYIFEQKRKYRENAKKGIYPSQCEGCFELKEHDWDNEDYINHLTAGHIMKCNSRCVYCPIGRIPDCHNREQDVDMKPIINELLEKNLLRFNGSLRFVGGEPTLMKEFDWLVDLFSKNNVPEIYVPTSAIRLSKSLCNALQKVESAAIVASVDSGTKETFEKVKGTKFFDIVMKNMQTYLKHARKKDFIISKFILFTNYNDTSLEVETWLKNCKNIGHIEVQFDSEHSVSSSENCENKKYVNRTLKMLKYTELLAEKYNIKVTSFLAFMNRAKRIYEKQVNALNSTIDLKDIKNIDFDEQYRNLYLNLDEDVLSFINKDIDNLVQNEKFSPKRKVFLTSKNEITKTKDFNEIIMQLLRLGFDVELSTSKLSYDKTLDEMIKTSYSEITFNLVKIPIISQIQKMIIKKKYKGIKLGNIKFD